MRLDHKRKRTLGSPEKLRYLPKPNVDKFNFTVPQVGAAPYYNEKKPDENLIKTGTLS